jgi:hypothetical protein
MLRPVISWRSIFAWSLLAIPVAAYSAPQGASMPRPGLATPQVPSVGQSFMTPRGPGFVTGGNGSMATATIPGSPGQGFLINNGNGTSTLIAPGSAPEILATPR